MWDVRASCECHEKCHILGDSPAGECGLGGGIGGLGVKS